MLVTRSHEAARRCQIHRGVHTLLYTEPPMSADNWMLDVDRRVTWAFEHGKAQGVLSDSVIKALQQVVIQHQSVAKAFGDAQKTVDPGAPERLTPGGPAAFAKEVKGKRRKGEKKRVRIGSNT